MVQKVVDWSDSNKLSLNHSKTKEIIIDRRRCKDEHPKIQIGGTEIEQVTTHKYLGMTLDNRLDYHDHQFLLKKKLAPECMFFMYLKNWVLVKITSLCIIKPVCSPSCYMARLCF
jgi:hypothetical protein